MSDRYRFILGSMIVGSLMVLAICIALGKVEEKTSYGLVPVMTVIAKVALDFSEWAYRKDSHSKDSHKDDKDKSPDKQDNTSQNPLGGSQPPPNA